MMTEKSIKIPVWLAATLTAAVLAVAGDTWRTVYQVKADLMCLRTALEAKGIISGGTDHEEKEVGTNGPAEEQQAAAMDAQNAGGSKRPCFEAKGWPSKTAKMTLFDDVADNPAIQTGKKIEN